MRTLVMACAVMLVLLPGLALAAQPETDFELEFEGTFVTDALCGFPLEAHEIGSIVHKHFFKDGEVVRHQTWVRTVATLTNPETSTRLTGRRALTDVVSEHSETEPVTVRGIVFHFTAPGKGPVLLDAGRATFYPDTGERLFEAGTHQWLDGDVAALCAALSE